MSEEEEKCPKCGKPMVIGWLGAGGLLRWVEGKKRSWTKRGERLESFWGPGGLRAYRCKECGIFICYEQGKRPDEEVRETPMGFMKECIQCGKMIPIASDYCPKCGTKQSE
jgi:RNA polymerase subunit RPABC4/transcription elongation factor Spt4